MKTLQTVSIYSSFHVFPSLKYKFTDDVCLIEREIVGNFVTYCSVVMHSMVFYSSVFCVLFTCVSLADRPIQDCQF